MKIAEKILVAILFIGILFRVLHWPGAGPLMVSSITILSTIYYIFSFLLLNNIRLRNVFKKNAYKKTSTKAIIFSIVVGLVVLPSLLMGIMFRIQIWPGSEVMLMASLAPSIVLLVIALIKNNVPVCKQFLYRAVPMFLVALSLYLLTEPKLVELTKPGYLPVYKAKQSLLDLNSQNEYNRKVRWLENKYFFARAGGSPINSHSFSDNISKSGYETYQIILNQDNDTLFQSAKDFDHMKISDLNRDGHEDFTTYDLDGNAKDYFFNPDSSEFETK